MTRTALASLFCVCVILSACGEADKAPENPEPLATAREPAATPPQLTPEQAILESAGKVQGYGIAYTPTPVIDQIPAWPILGLANGEIFTAQSVIIRPAFGVWEMEIHDVPVDPMKSKAIARSSHPAMQTVSIKLPREPAAGEVFERPLDYGGGIFQIKPSPDAENTTSWNTSIAWVIEFTEWNRAPWQEGGRTFQQGGTASGRLYVCFEGSAESLDSSFVAGEFKDVPIMYYGKPEI